MTANSTTETAPCEQYEKTGWMKRFDELHANPDLPMAGPWNWEIHDYSMATLCGGGEDATIGGIMAIGPCPACAERAEPKEWKWDRCQTPSEANARLIAAAPDMLKVLQAIRNKLHAHNRPDNMSPAYNAIRMACRDLADNAIAKATAPLPSSNPSPGPER